MDTDSFEVSITPIHILIKDLKQISSDSELSELHQSSELFSEGIKPGVTKKNFEMYSDIELDGAVFRESEVYTFEKPLNSFESKKGVK